MTSEQIKVTATPHFAALVDAYAKTRGGITRGRALWELAYKGMRLSGMLDENGNFDTDYEAGPPPILIGPKWGGKRDGAGRKPDFKD